MVTLKNEVGIVKKAPTGFSWTMLFFGFLVPLVRGDIKWTVLHIVASVITVGIAWLILPFMYNKRYLLGLIKKGYKPADAASEKQLNKLGVALEIAEKNARSTQVKRNIGGWIEAYALEDWWFSVFDGEERKKITSTQPETTHGEYSPGQKSPAQLLCGLATFFKNSEDRNIAIRLLEKAEEVGREKQDVVNLHFTYSQMIDVLYPQRDEPGVLNRIIDICKKQIAIGEEVLEGMQEEYEESLKKSARVEGKSLDQMKKERTFTVPSHRGFKQLAIIKEKQGDYEEVVDLAKKAKEQGWRGDWDQRMERAKGKIQR